MEDCKACSVFVHDVLQRPIDSNVMYSDMMRQKRLLRIMPELVREIARFIRNKSGYLNINSYLVLRCVEEGLVHQARKYNLDPRTICKIWVNSKVKEIGDLDQIHIMHSGGFSNPSPLRISIPHDNDDLYC